MKKKVMSIFVTAALLTAATAPAIFADGIDGPPVIDGTNTEVQEDIMPISDDFEFAAPLAMPSYISNLVDVVSVDKETISTAIAGTDAENQENVINYTITADTVILGMNDGKVLTMEDVKEGDTIRVYSNSYAPAPLILPPQYQANVIFVDDAKEISSNRFVEVDTFIENEEGMLVGAGNTLALNVDDSTTIMEVKGKKIIKADELPNNDLAVIYSTSTRSIPPQTTPIAIIVLGENEMALAQIEAAKADADTTPAPTETPEVTSSPAPTPEATQAPLDYTTITSVTAGSYTAPVSYSIEKNAIIVPVRAVAEALGCTVGWDGDNMGVTVDDVMFKIGFNSYIKSGIAQSLEAAPELLNDTTFVPVTLFSDVMGYEFSADAGVLTISK